MHPSLLDATQKHTHAQLFKMSQCSVQLSLPSFAHLFFSSQFVSLSFSLTHTHTYTLSCSHEEEVGWFQGVWEQIIHVYRPQCTRSKALLTGPEAAVHFREVAVERFSGIIRGRGEAFGALQEPLTKWSNALLYAPVIYGGKNMQTSAHKHTSYMASASFITAMLLNQTKHACGHYAQFVFTIPGLEMGTLPSSIIFYLHRRLL